MAKIQVWEIPENAAALKRLSERLNIPQEWIIKQIQTESGWNPTIKNPFSSARGLIQFMDSTAKSLGYSGGSKEIIERFPTVAAQLETPVYQYYSQFLPIEKEGELYMSTFYPKWRKEKDWDNVFPLAIQKANPNIKTPRDYVKIATSKAISKKKISNEVTIHQKPILIFSIAAALGVIVYLQSRKKKNR